MNIQIETSQADFISEKLSIVGEPVYRTPVPGSRGRFYFTFEKGSNRPILLTTGTTIISEGFADPYKTEILTKWRTSEILSGRNPDETVKYRQDYGTILHGLYGLLLQKSIIPIGESDAGENRLEEFVREQDFKISEKSLSYIFTHYNVELQKDLLSFHKWVNDYNVKPLAIELMAWLPKYKVGSAIDLICELDLEVTGYHGEVYKSNTGKRLAGDPKKSKKKVRVIAIVDFKSGKKGFHNEHVLQLLLYKMMLNENYGINVEHVFNFAPSDWRVSTGASYKFVRQDLKQVGGYFDEVMKLGMKRFEAKPTKYNILMGNVSLDPEVNSAGYIEVDLMLELYKKFCPELVDEYLEEQELLATSTDLDDDDEEYILEFRESRRLKMVDDCLSSLSVEISEGDARTLEEKLMDSIDSIEDKDGIIFLGNLFNIDTNLKGKRLLAELIKKVTNPEGVEFNLTDEISNHKAFQSYIAHFFGNELDKESTKVEKVDIPTITDNVITEVSEDYVDEDIVGEVESIIYAHYLEGNFKKGFITEELNKFSMEQLKMVCISKGLSTYRRRKIGLIRDLYKEFKDSFAQKIEEEEEVTNL